MRTKRSKVYKRAMALYTTAFKFREPYQVLVDSEFVQRASLQKIDLYARFENIFGGPAKIMITQCAIKHLYDKGREAAGAIEYAKSFERRKCNHWKTKDTDDECIGGVMGDLNRYKYCIATQSNKLRSDLRKVPGVPLLFEKRSIILLEPPSEASVAKRHEIEESKLHISNDELSTLRPKASTSAAQGIANADADVSMTEEGTAPAPAPALASGVDAKSRLPAATRSTAAAQPATAEQLMNRSHNANKRKRGQKDPNPLSVKKKKPRTDATKPAAGKASPQRKDGKGTAPAGSSAKVQDKSGDKAKGKGRAAGGSSDGGAAAAGLAKESNKENQNHAATDSRGQDPTKGVPRPEGDGTSKKALKRKAKKAAEAEEKSGGGGGAQAGEKPKVKSETKVNKEANVKSET